MLRLRYIAIALIVCPLLARADNNELYGLGPRSSSMGGAMTAEANDYSAVYYNPSLLVNNKDSNFGISLQYYKPTMTVAKTGGDPALGCTNCQPRDSLGGSLGFIFPLGGKLKNRLAIGLGLTLPTSVLLRVSAPERTSPFWYRYDSAPERFLLHVGAGLKLVDWLNVGAGIQVLSDLVGNGTATKVDLFSKQVRTSQINSYLANRFGPVFGLTVTPWRRLKFGATFRWEMKMLYQIPASVDLEGIGKLDFELTGVVHFSPHQLQFGASFDALDNLTISLDGEWSNWAAAPSPYMNMKMAISGATLSALGLENAFDIESAQQAAGFTDTMTGRLGIEWRVNDRFTARAGGFYRPTMVPRQDTAGTNTLDGSALGLTAGVGFNFADPLEVFENPLKVDISGHGTFIMQREANKAATDVVPAYRYAGNVGGLSVGLRYDY